MELIPLSAANREEIRRYFGKNPSRICEFTNGVVFLWDVDERASFCVEDGTFYMANISDGTAHFNYPIGGDEAGALEKIRAFCLERNYKLVFRFLTAEQKEIIDSKFSTVAESDRNWADYLYSASELRNLSGRKFHGQKNHINRFARQYPNHKFVAYSEKMEGLAYEFFEKFYGGIEKNDEVFYEEKRVFLKLLKDFSKEELLGGVLLVNGKIVAVSFGEVVGDTLYIHFEKALREYAGSYAMINYLFANTFGQNVEYINREEDVGDEGLRTAKLNLHPVQIIEKYFAEANL